jgi:hypothetical protein
LTVERPGLVTHDEYAYIRGSPDVIVQCTCCPAAHLGEIKCPYNGRELSVSELVANGTIDYIVVNDHGQYELLAKNNRGYYHQMQLLMAVCKLQFAYFVIWTTVSSEIVIVLFDENHWLNEMLPHISYFFENYVVAELLTERVKRGLSLIDGNAIASNNQQQEDMDIDELLSELIATEGSDVLDQESETTDVNACSVTDKSIDKLSQAVLSCSSNCCNESAPASIQDKLLKCDANLKCLPGSVVHMACQGFVKNIHKNNLSKKFVCTFCRQFHPENKKLIKTRGFL